MLILCLANSSTLGLTVKGDIRRQVGGVMLLLLVALLLRLLMAALVVLLWRQWHFCCRLPVPP
jgi:hypothetical protein